MLSRRGEIWFQKASKRHSEGTRPLRGGSKVSSELSRCQRPQRGFIRNIQIRAPANRRRAEGSLYVLETAFTVQRALCTFEGKGHPVQKATLSLRNVQTLAPIGLNSKCVKTRPKFTRAPRGRIWSMRTKVRPQYTKRVRIDDSSPTFAARGPRRRGVGGRETSPHSLSYYMV